MDLTRVNWANASAARTESEIFIDVEKTLLIRGQKRLGNKPESNAV